MRPATFAIAEKGGFISTTLGTDGRIEVIVDLGGVEARDGDGRKEGGEQRRPGLGQLVQHERAAGDLGQDGEEAGSGRRLQHAVRRPDGGCGQGREAERGRRRELLEGLALGGAAGVGREKAGDLGQGGKPGSRRVGFAEQRLSVFAEEEDGRGLAGVIGRLPVPGAGGVGGAESRFHGGAQDRGVDALAALEMREELLGGGDDRAGGVGMMDRRRRGLVGRDRRKVVHEGSLGRAGTGEPAGALSRTAPAQTRPGRPLPLSVAAVAGIRKGAPPDGGAPRLWRSSVAELPGGPGLAVVCGGDRFGEVAGVAFNDSRIGDRRFIDDGDARDQPVLDLDMDGHAVGEDDTARLGLLIGARGRAVRMDAIVVERDILDHRFAAVRR